jgi:hypothetical protein
MDGILGELFEGFFLKENSGFFYEVIEWNFLTKLVG